jgi:hypothetical protein
VSPRPVPPQSAILLVALVLAAAGGAASFAGLALAYVVAWALVNGALARGIALPALDRPRAITVGLLIAVAPAMALASRFDAIAEHEGLHHPGPHLADRLRLERSPAMHPDLVTTDRPQRFFVRAEGASAVRVTLAPGVRAIEALAMGHGVFRVDYDPRREGVPDARGWTTALLEVDGTPHERAVEVIAPLAHPRWLRASPDRTRACTTSEETDELVIVDANGLVARRDTDDAPSDCAMLPNGRVVVAHRHASWIAIVDLERDAAERIEVGPWANRLAVDDGARVAVAHEDGFVSVVDLAAGRVIERTPVGGLADWVVWSENVLVVARRAPAALLRVFHGRVLQTRALAAPAVTLAGAAGFRIALAVTDWSDAPEPAAHLGNHYVQDEIVVLDPRDLEVVDRMPTARRSARQDAAGGLDRGLSPMVVDGVSPRDWPVAFAGSDEVAIFSLLRGVPDRTLDVARLGLAAPTSAVRLAGPVFVVSSAASGRIAVLAPDGTPRATIALAPDDATLLRDDPDALRRRFGERAFHEATRSGVSCQSCHLHGASDELLHNIGGRVLVPTLDVRGVRGTAPYLRDGSYPRLGDLHEVARTLYRGWRDPAGDRAATLEAWMASLPPPLPLAAIDDTRARRGLDVFVRAGCPDCHALPAASGLGRHPIASVFPDADAPGDVSLDAPSLRATSRRTRWLFDGRARSLGAIFTRENASGRHGDTRALRSDDITDLVGWLETL